MASLQGQIIVQSGTVRANVGIDADVYSDITTYTTPPWLTPAGTDDWIKTTGGTGKGIIDVTSPSALAQIALLNGPASSNPSAELRMSYPFFTLVDNRLWVDAV